jgi:hypothetical protein
VIGWLSVLILPMSIDIITVSSVARPVKAALFYRAGDLKKVTKISPRRGRVMSWLCRLPRGAAIAGQT